VIEIAPLPGIVPTTVSAPGDEDIATSMRLKSEGIEGVPSHWTEITPSLVVRIGAEGVGGGEVSPAMVTETSAEYSPGDVEERAMALTRNDQTSPVGRGPYSPVVAGEAVRRR